MQIKDIEWEYTGNDSWLGRSGDLLKVCFHIVPKGGNEYKLSSDKKLMKEEICTGLDKAKERAQDILNSYAITISLT